MKHLFTHATGCVAAELSAVQDPFARECRREAIATKPPSLRKLGLQALYHGMPALRRPVEAMFSRPYKKRGFDVIGVGYMSTVLADPTGGEVIKVVRASRGLGSNDRARLMSEIAGLVAVNIETHPAVALPTEVEVGCDPIGDGSIILLRQPLVVLDEHDPDDLARQKYAFAMTSLDNMLPRGVLPDVAGGGNLVSVNGELRLIDTVALPEVSPAFYFQRVALGAMVHRIESYHATTSSV